MTRAIQSVSDAAVADVSLTVVRETDVPQVIAAAREFCLSHGLSPLLTAHVCTAASELANNLWMHAHGGGQIHLHWHGAGLGADHPAGVELRAEDHGPGIADLGLALSDGWSSVGSLGCGLPGVLRLMDRFDIASTPGTGTQVRAFKGMPTGLQPGARRSHGH